MSGDRVAMEPGWHVILPVRGGARAKSRLQPPDGVDLATLARAMALDSISAVLATPGVQAAWVVTPDPDDAADLRSLGATVLGERRPGMGLNAALHDARGEVALANSGKEQLLTSVLLPDVPALRPDDVQAALAACTAEFARHAAESVFVPDTEGTGTVLLAAPRPEALPLAFGARSAQRHELLGARRCALELPRLRRDVDTAEELAEAVALGVGPRTAQQVRGAA